MNNEHELKCWTEFFPKIVTGVKRFEARKNDRDFKVGDILWLREWDHHGLEYTGREVRAEVTYILQNTLMGTQPDWCVMSIEVFQKLGIE